MKNLGLFVKFYMNLHSRSQAQKLGLRLRLHQKVAAPPAPAPQHWFLRCAPPPPQQVVNSLICVRLNQDIRNKIGGHITKYSTESRELVIWPLLDGVLKIAVPVLV
jgi:hypothetical protein